MKRTTGTQQDTATDPGLGAEVRESVLLLSLSVAVTAAVTIGAHAALSLLG